MRAMRGWVAAIALGVTLGACGAGITANPRMAPKITSVPPATATVGAPFLYTVTAEGMTPMTFAVASGPPGLEIHPGAGTVSWVPQSAGTVSVRITASNLAGKATQEFEIEVAPLSGPVFVTEPPTEATVGAPYAYDPQVVASEAVSWSAPVAPQGMSIDPESGSVRWTPSPDQAGTRSVTLRATEQGSGLFAEQSFALEVVDTGGPAVITSMPPDRVYEGELWRYEAAAAGAPTIEWALEPHGSVAPATGVVIRSDPPQGDNVVVEWDTTGTSPGEYGFSLRADNTLGSPSVQPIVITVEPRPPVPEIDLVSSPPPATVFVGSAYHYDLALTPQSESEGVVWSLVGIPVPADLGVTVASSTGMVDFIAPDPRGQTEYRYTVRAENVLGEGDEATITVQAVFPPAAPVLTVTPGVMFTLQVGQAFSGASATATGEPTPALSISGALPDFLDFDPMTGLLSASPAKPAPEEADIGSYSFDIVASNNEGEDRVAIEVVVVAPPPRVDSVTPAAGRRQSDVPIVVRGDGFVAAVAPVVRLEMGSYAEPLSTTFIDAQTLAAIVPADLARPPGVYDVIVDQGSTTALAKRFTVTAGAGVALSGSVSVDTTLHAADNPHLVTGSVRVENGATLTLEPGAVVMLGSNSNLVIDVGTAGAGALVADGGEPGQADQVVITRFQEAGGPPPSGYYRGLRFGAYNMASITVLRNVVIEFGGRDGSATERGAIEVLGGSAPRIGQSVVRESFNYGLFVQSGGGSAAFEWLRDTQITSAVRSPISIGSDEVSTLGPNLDLLGNGQDRIFVRGLNVSRPAASWENLGVPYYSRDGLLVRGGSTMTIAPGTELRFAPGKRLRVSTDAEPGTLVASGTSQAPIRMVADSGAWNGIFLDGSIRGGTVLRHVHATGIAQSANGALRIDNPVTAADRVAVVESCSFRSEEPGSVAVYLAPSARVLSFENNVLDVAGWSVDASLGGFSDVLKPSNTYQAPLRVRSGLRSGLDLLWSPPVSSDQSVQPIRPSGSLTISAGSLTILAGSRVQMPLDGQLLLLDSTLSVQGTASEPVTFEPAPGVAFWRRIQLRGAGSGVSEIGHGVITGAGSDPSLDASPQRAAIVIGSNAGIAASPSVHDTLVVASRGYGMTFLNSTHCGGRCNDNTIVGSRFSAVWIAANSVGRFGAGNALSGNDTSGALGHEGVWVVGGTIDLTAAWPSIGVPYVVQGDVELRQSSPLDPIPVWTIEPGAELRFAPSRRLRVGRGNDGVLRAQGTAAAPITFTTIDPAAPTFWLGIDFDQGSDGSLLDHVSVSYAGSTSGTGNVIFRSGSIVEIGAAQLTHSASYAGRIDAGSAPSFVGPAAQRYYGANGQASNPGPGDPAFNCFRDVAAGACIQP